MVKPKAVENPDAEPDGPVVVYICDRCKRKAEFVMYTGLPMRRVPCGPKCGGTLVLAPEMDIRK